MVTCGGLVIRLVLCQKLPGPIANRPQDTILPHKIKSASSAIRSKQQADFQSAAGYQPAPQKMQWSDSFSALVRRFHGNGFSASLGLIHAVGRGGHSIVKQLLIDLYAAPTK